MQLKKFIVSYCPKCSKYQITSAKALHCKYCSKSTKIKQKNKFGFAISIIKSFDNPRVASKFLQAYQHEINKDKFIGFTEYGR